MSMPALTSRLLAWYDSHRRQLPWRAAPGGRPDPYAVWLSEVMLQQTTTAAVKGYYARFLARWPTVAALAAAPLEEVLREWAGLGYYARARNLHACAAAVVAEHGGRFPRTEAALRTLPGIGDYTAASIAAIAFDEPAAVVDGNVERVMARLGEIEEPLPASRRLIRRRVAELVPEDRPGDFAQAMMDLGATLCTPKSPACALCPLMADCRARAAGTQSLYPRKAPKRASPARTGAMAVVERADGAVLVRTRPARGLLGGMTEFFGSDWTGPVPTLAALACACDAELEPRGSVGHVFTHFSLTLAVYAGRSRAGQAPEGYRWVSRDALAREPIPQVFAKVLEAARSATTRPTVSTSALVALGPSLGLVGLERTDQHGRGERQNREAKARR